MEAFATSLRKKAGERLSVSGDIQETITSIREANEALEQLHGDMTILAKRAQERLSIGGVIVPRSIVDLLRPIGSSFGAEQDNEAFDSIRELISGLGDADQLLGSFDVQIDKTLKESRDLISGLNTRIQNAKALKRDSIKKLVRSVDEEAKAFVEHIDELSEEPFNEVIERIEDFRGDTLEGPVGDVLDAIQEVEGLIETLEDSGIAQLEELANVVDDVMTAVEVVKSIPAP